MKLATILATLVLGASTAAVAQPVAVPYDRDRDHHHHDGYGPGNYGDHDNNPNTVDGYDTRWVTVSPSVRNHGNLQVVRIGNQRGRFEALRIRMDSGQMFVRTVGIVFNDGSVQKFRLGRYLQAGQVVDVDLPGRHRVIRRVQVWTDPYHGYRATGAFSLLAARAVSTPQYGYQTWWPYRR